MIGPLKRGLGRALGLDVYVCLEAASSRLLSRNGDVLMPYIRTDMDEIRRHVVDLSYDQTVSQANLDELFHSSRNRWRLNKFVVRLAETVRILRDALGPDPHVSILDVGAGNGVVMRQLDYQMTGVDLSEGCVAAMRAHGLAAAVAAADQLPFASGTFDYATAFECIEHLRNPLGALAEMNRVARKGALISIPYVRQTRVLGFPGRESLHADPVAARRRIENYHVVEFSDDDMRRLVGHVGFRVARTHHIRPYSLSASPARQALERYYGAGRPTWTVFELKKS